MRNLFVRRRRPRRQMPPRAVFVVAAGVLGALVGAVAEYLLDPARGHARRAGLRERSAAAVRRPVRRARRTASKDVAYLRGRAHRMGHRLSRSHPPVDDRTLVDRVRSEVFGRRPFRGVSVNMDAVDGVLTLRGQLEDQDAIRDLVDAVGKVAGVRGVESMLHTPDAVAPNVVGLQRPER